MENTYHFQVNLGGMLDVLSNHLYKSPDVFLRELLQNGMDAVTLRQKSQPDWNRGKITITVEPGRRLIFRDNGAGLSEEGIHRFLAVIGQSSKTELVNGKIPEDYIGRFGIGLLSCFMVSDSIVVHTQPAAGGGAHVWTGLPDGTYTLEPLEECLVGTAVILTAKPGMEHYFQPRKVTELVRYYGLALPVPVYLSGDPERLKQVFCNVLDNASKHGGSGKRISASICEEGDWQVVRVRDYGPGIPEEELPFVKQKFYKGSSKARGSGIGLAVCDEIIGLHGGTFTIGNAEGGGAIVTIRLPEIE